jgi:hypothetical protein
MRSPLSPDCERCTGPQQAGSRGHQVTVIPHLQEHHPKPQEVHPCSVQMGDPAGSCAAPWVSLAHSAHSAPATLSESLPHGFVLSCLCPHSPRQHLGSTFSPPTPSSQVTGLWTLLSGHFSLTSLETRPALCACPSEQGTALGLGRPQPGLLLGTVGLAQPLQMWKPQALWGSTLDRVSRGTGSGLARTPSFSPHPPSVLHYPLCVRRTRLHVQILPRPLPNTVPPVSPGGLGQALALCA